MRVAIDAVGGDFGPRGAVEGAMEASKRLDYDLILVGEPRNIGRFLKARRFSSPRITIVPATEKVDMSEHAKDSLRKRDSSIAVAAPILLGFKQRVIGHLGGPEAVPVPAPVETKAPAQAEVQASRKVGP